MSRIIKPLSATQVSNAKAKEKLYKLFDGGGLFLQVNPSGGKHWKMKYRKLDGKESLLTFGAYPAITLEQARKKRDEAKSMLANNIDPAVAKQELKEELRLKANNTFEKVAYEWLEIHSTKATPRTLTDYLRILQNHIFPCIGKQLVSNLKPLEFLEVLRKIESKGTLYTVKRARSIMSMIMRYSVATGKAEHDPISSLRGALKTYKPKHLASTTEPKKVASILRRLQSHQSNIVVSYALQILPYVFVRPSELRQAKWQDINFDTCEWRYLVTKTNTPHIVPLAPQVIKLLKELHEYTGGFDYLFPSRSKNAEFIAKNTLLVGLRTVDIKEEEMSAHGFRAMARTLLDEELGERYDLIEQQLAHLVRDPNGRAYNRTQHLAERHRMMARWADYLDKLRDEAE